MVFGGYRPLTELQIAAVTNEELEPMGLTCWAYGTAGVAVQSQAVPWIRMTYAGPKHLQDFDITTNTGPARPMRAPSGPPAFFALESLMDQLAHQVGVSPVALRRKWDDSDVREGLYEWVESLPVWRDRAAVGTGSGRMRSGVGFAIGNWFNAFNNATRIELVASAEAGLVARCAVQDMGNGSRSVIAKAIGETLGVSPHDVGLEVGVAEVDVPVGPNSSASRTTPSVYPTSIDAAERLKAALLKVAAKSGLSSPRWAPGAIEHDGGRVGVFELLGSLEEPVRVVSHRRGGNSTFDLLGAMPSGRMGVSVFPKMTGSVAVARVDVDTMLGRVYPREVWVGISVGKIVNPELARSQIYGAVIQSVGFALTEQRHYDPATGRLLSANLEDYRIPGIGDTPEVHVFFDESGFQDMKGGACGLSELATLAPPPAIANAVFHATGWRPHDLPMRPQVVQSHVSHLTTDA